MMELERCPLCEVLVPKGDACQDGEESDGCPMGEECPGPKHDDND